MLRALRAGAAAKITDALRKIMQHRGLAEHVATIVAFFYKMAGVVILLGVGLADVGVITTVFALRTNASCIHFGIVAIDLAVIIDAAKINLFLTIVDRTVNKNMTIAARTATI